MFNKMIIDMVMKKLKEMFDEFWNTMNLDKDDKLDKDQFHAWMDRVGAALHKGAAGLDFSKVMEAVAEVNAVLKEAEAYVQAVQKHMEAEAKKK